MKGISIFITDDIAHRLKGAAQRERRSQAEIVREALSKYPEGQVRPWPKSIGIASNPDPWVTSKNLKDWIRGGPGPMGEPRAS